jgi:hypothetical protein
MRDEPADVLKSILVLAGTLSSEARPTVSACYKPDHDGREFGQ